ALVQILSQLEEPLSTLERRGISLPTFLPRATDRGLPAWRVKLAGREEWFHTEDEADAFVKAQQERLGGELVGADEETATGNGNGHGNGSGTTFAVLELHEVTKKDGINRWLKELAARGLGVADLLPLPRIAGREPPPRFVLQNGDQKRLLPHLRDLVSEVRRLGEGGLSITRFNGLGEMNAEELWESTLDPARRTLLQVHLDDALNADA